MYFHEWTRVSTWLKSTQHMSQLDTYVKLTTCRVDSKPVKMARLPVLSVSNKKDLSIGTIPVFCMLLKHLFGWINSDCTVPILKTCWRDWQMGQVDGPFSLSCHAAPASHTASHTNWTANSGHVIAGDESRWIHVEQVVHKGPYCCLTT